jgi:hypothetical protein
MAAALWLAVALLAVACGSGAVDPLGCFPDEINYK